MNQKIIHGYRVTIAPSIYTNRSGKTDVRIQRESDWGAKHENGCHYSTAQVLSAEDFEILRSYTPIQGHALAEILDYARSVIAQLANEVAA